MENMEDGQELGAVRLGKLLNERDCKVKKKELALQLDMTAEWLSKYINQKGKAAGRRMPVETLMLVSFILAGRRAAFDDLFVGTVEHTHFHQLPEPIQLAVTRIADLNTERLMRGEAIINRENIGSIMQHAIGWSSATWADVLDGELALPEDGASRRMMAEALGIAYQDLRYEGEPEPYDVLPSDVDWLLVDRLVLEKLRSPRGIEGDAAEAKADFRFVRHNLARAVGEEEWQAIPLEVRRAIIKTALPWARRWRYVNTVRKRPGPVPDAQAAREVISLAAGMLPHISESIVSSATGLHERRLAGKGMFVRHHAQLLGIPAHELALLLLGIAATQHFPATAKAVERRRSKTFRRHMEQAPE